MIKINRSYFIVLLAVFFSSMSYSQNKYLTTDDSDQEALSLVSDAKEKLNNSESLVFDYTFISKSKDDSPQIINGAGKQKGDKFYLEMGDQTLYCDGKDITVFFNTQNEAQINDYDKDESQMTPSSLLKSFSNKEYIYVLLPNKKIKNKIYKNILLKPVDKYSDYIKVDILIDELSGLPFKFKMFVRDGTHNILEINSLKMNQKVDESVFIFDKTKHPGVIVEDLRMD
ncbi:MAG TPA: outer membrane lipoprotein carrier protein LolA [Bacteroidetes bacterium]|nr:outer membrane lipoprotein carrier protein LolA [Bacteroidota bacterium]